MSPRTVAPAVGLLLLALSGLAQCAPATRVVGIKLEDSSTDPAITHMRIVLDHDSVKPGRVMLKAQNDSKALVHEVLVLREPDTKALPYDAKKAEVIESRVHSLGEIHELPPGKAGSLTLTLKPGSYLLFCNQAGHYKDGMQARLTVAR